MSSRSRDERARRGVFIGLSGSLLMVACGSGNASSSSSTIDPKLSVIEQQVFHPSCTFSSCHGADSPKQGLNLSGTTYQSLVNQPSTEASGRTLVIPSNPDDSYLLEKLTKDKPSFGSRMPYTSSPLAEDRIAVIRQWIQLGAQND